MQVQYFSLCFKTLSQWREVRGVVQWVGCRRRCRRGCRCRSTNFPCALRVMQVGGVQVPVQVQVQVQVQVLVTL